MYLKDSNAASHFVNSLILFALSRTGILFAHALQKNVSNRCILVPRAHDPSGLWQGSRALAGPDFLSMRRAFVSYSRPIRFDGKSVNRGLPVLDQGALSQSSRSLPQARRIVGSGDENVTGGTTGGMRLLCVCANRKMAVVLTNFLAMFPFVTCVKESENQPNGFVESRRKSQPSPFQQVKA